MALDEFAPDVVVVWGDDQYENFREEGHPAVLRTRLRRCRRQPLRADEAPRQPETHGACPTTQPSRCVPTRMGPADLRTNSSAEDSISPTPTESAVKHLFRTQSLNTQLFLDYPKRRVRTFDYRLIPITVNCYGQHAIARQGGLARFAAIADERLDPSGPTARPACFRAGPRGSRRRFRDNRLTGRAWWLSSSWSHAFLTDKNVA